MRRSDRALRRSATSGLLMCARAMASALAVGGLALGWLATAAVAPAPVFVPGVAHADDKRPADASLAVEPSFEDTGLSTDVRLIVRKAEIDLRDRGEGPVPLHLHSTWFVSLGADTAAQKAHVRLWLARSARNVVARLDGVDAKLVESLDAADTAANTVAMANTAVAAGTTAVANTPVAADAIAHMAIAADTAVDTSMVAAADTTGHAVASADTSAVTTANSPADTTAVATGADTTEHTAVAVTTEPAAVATTPDTAAPKMADKTADMAAYMTADTSANIYRLSLRLEPGVERRLEIEYDLAWTKTGRSPYELAVDCTLAPDSTSGALHEVEITFHPANPTPLPALAARPVPYSYAPDSLGWRLANVRPTTRFSIAYAPRVAEQYKDRYLTPLNVRNLDYPWDHSLVSFPAVVSGAALDSAWSAADRERAARTLEQLEDAAREANWVKRMITDGRADRLLTPIEKLNVGYCRALMEAIHDSRDPRQMRNALAELRTKYW